MRRKMGYAKLGRSMPLRLDNCGSLGGDNELYPTLKLLAERHSEVDFYLVGRNSGEHPAEVGLPSNVYNPWTEWRPKLRNWFNNAKLNYSNLSINDHQRAATLLHELTTDVFYELDGIVMWLGQHGTTNTPLPKVNDRSTLTKPYDWATLYGSYLLQNINDWRDRDPLRYEEVILNSDARNYIKYRDSKWPWRHPVLAQYNDYHNVKLERYGEVTGWGKWMDFNVTPIVGDDERANVWATKSRSIYSRLEISSLIPGTPFGDLLKFNGDWRGRQRFGIVINETRREVNPAKTRLRAMQDWVLPLEPDLIRGHWSAASQAAMNRTIVPVSLQDYPTTIQQVHSTFTTPASGSGWATAKPWEAFALGVVCFFHPMYDDQGNILRDAPQELRDFLRVDKPATLKRRVDMVHSDRELWDWAVALQHEHYLRAIGNLDYLTALEGRLGLGGN